MLRFIIKRVLLGIAALIAVTLITFYLMNLIPGGPFLSEKSLAPEVLAAMNAKYGLNKPLHQQYFTWVTDLLRGDLGVSFKMQKNRPVLTIIKEMFPTSVKVGSFAVLWATLFGVALGSFAAYRRGRLADSVLRVVTTMGVVVPAFVTASILLVVISGNLPKIFPSIVDRHAPWHAYILPCFTLGLNPMCNIARYSRAAMLDALSQEYIRTAYSKGLSVRAIIFKHALRNALIPVISYVGPMIAYVLTGGFVVETVFSIPGLGRYFVQSVQNRDYPVIMGTAVFLAFFIILMTFIVDILYKLIDPRIDITEEAN
ncbi:MAG: ABC transporter permease [Oscillospiraceae bacterium]|nr:ABC transporter permease [Oscillospiraceae bacterium]